MPNGVPWQNTFLQRTVQTYLTTTDGKRNRYFDRDINLYDAVLALNTYLDTFKGNTEEMEDELQQRLRNIEDNVEDVLQLLQAIEARLSALEAH